MKIQVIFSLIGVCLFFSCILMFVDEEYANRFESAYNLGERTQLFQQNHTPYTMYKNMSEMNETIRQSREAYEASPFKTIRGLDLKIIFVNELNMNPKALN